MRVEDWASFRDSPGLTLNDFQTKEKYSFTFCELCQNNKPHGRYIICATFISQNNVVTEFFEPTALPNGSYFPKNKTNKQQTPL